jgi:enoyl-CoA hydratase
MMMMDSGNGSFPLLDCETTNGVALVTLNDPTRRNAVTGEMRAALLGCFDRLEADPDVGAVVITGAGTAFCAGADLGDLAVAGASDFRVTYDVFLRVARSSLPTIAAVNGPAVGAGLNLALACDVRLAGRSAQFITKFLQLGLHPGGGNTWMLSRAVGPQVAASMLLFNEVLDGEAAARCGLALRCVDDDLLVQDALLFGEQATLAPRELVGRVKETLRGIPAVTCVEDALERELIAQVWSSEQPFFRRRIQARHEKPQLAQE